MLLLVLHILNALVVDNVLGVGLCRVKDDKDLRIVRVVNARVIGDVRVILVDGRRLLVIRLALREPAHQHFAHKHAVSVAYLADQAVAASDVVVGYAA